MSDLIQFRKSNHFVPQFYLRNFACAPGMIQEYSLLVSHHTVRPWTKRAIKRVACLDHLYTKVTANAESDEIEQWLQRDFEVPAEEAIKLAVSESQMERRHFHALARFFALQDLRTIKNYVRTREHYITQFNSTLEGVIQDLVQEYQAARREDRPLPIRQRVSEDDELLGIKTRVSPTSDKPGMGSIHVEMNVGRHSWLHSLRFILKRGEALSHLTGHRWTILHSPRGSSFITSDHPIVKLGFNSDRSRNLKGGWGRPDGGVLMMPLSPRHLLYTEIGRKVPWPGFELNPQKVTEINRLIADSALRSIYSAVPLDMRNIRERHVDAVMFKEEKLELESWHQQQTEALRS